MSNVRAVPGVPDGAGADRTPATTRASTSMTHTVVITQPSSGTGCTSAVAPLIWNTSTLVPTGMTWSSS